MQSGILGQTLRLQDYCSRVTATNCPSLSLYSLRRLPPPVRGSLLDGPGRQACSHMCTALALKYAASACSLSFCACRTLCTPSLTASQTTTWPRSTQASSTSWLSKPLSRVVIVVSERAVSEAGGKKQKSAACCGGFFGVLYLPHIQANCYRPAPPRPLLPYPAASSAQAPVRAKRQPWPGGDCLRRAEPHTGKACRTRRQCPVPRTTGPTAR